MATINLDRTDQVILMRLRTVRNRMNVHRYIKLKLGQTDRCPCDTVPMTSQHLSQLCHRLVGLVVKASASRAEGPGFDSRLHRDFFGVESYQ